MAVALQVFYHLTYFLLGRFHFIRLTGKLYLGAARQDFKEGVFLFQQVELTVVDAEKLYGIYGV